MSRILIVEDEPLFGAVLLQKLRGAGYEVDLARDGQEGLEKLRAQRFDLLVADAVTPVVSGLELLAEKKKDPTLEGVPVIMLTNSYEPPSGAALGALGIGRFMVKANVTPDEVVAAVGEILGPGVRTDKPEMSPDSVSLAGQRVLLVEDDDFLAKVLVTRLGAEGATVAYFKTAEAALADLAEATPNVALLDILLPGMSGLDLLDRMRAGESTKAVPAVMISNFNQEPEKERARAHGASYLVKAMVDPDEILREAKRAIAAAR